MTRVLFWGGPWHDTAREVPDHMIGRPILAANDRGEAVGRTPAREVDAYPLTRYEARRMADLGASGVRGALARDRRDVEPWWWVYVSTAAPPSLVEHWQREASRPIVDGPRAAPAVLLDRARARRLADPARDVVPLR